MYKQKRIYVRACSILYTLYSISRMRRKNTRFHKKTIYKLMNVCYNNIRNQVLTKVCKEGGSVAVTNIFLN